MYSDHQRFEETGLKDVGDSDTTITIRVLAGGTGKVLARDPATATEDIHIVNGLGSYELVIDRRVAAVADNDSKVQTFGNTDNATWAAGKSIVEIGTSLTS